METPPTALLTDHYELTMLTAARGSGVASRLCVFEVFARSLPPGRRYGVVAGTGRLLDALADFRFEDDVLDQLHERRAVDEATAAWLADWRFRGDIWGYREGELFFPGSPVLTVEATFADAIVLETLVLSILNHDSAIASAAARMVVAAAGRPLLEFGSRRTHEAAAIASARAAWIAGFEATSNLAAGTVHDLPTAGTSAHAFTLVHDDEAAAFAAQVASLGTSTTLLVDTFEEVTAVAHAVKAAGVELGAVRIDSGDLGGVARAVRAELDRLGATRTRIVASSDLDEFAIAALADAPIDSYGVGTRLVTGSGAPTAGFVYKLVAREGRGGELVPVAKTAHDKGTVGGRKLAARQLRRGVARCERVSTGRQPRGRHLQVPLVDKGEVLPQPDLDAIRDHHRTAMAELPDEAFQLEPGEPAIPTVHE